VKKKRSKEAKLRANYPLAESPYFRSEYYLSLTCSLGAGTLLYKRFSQKIPQMQNTTFLPGIPRY